METRAKTSRMGRFPPMVARSRILGDLWQIPSHRKSLLPHRCVFLVGWFVFTARLALHLLNSFVLLSVLLQDGALSFVFPYSFFFSLPRRKPPLLVFSISLMPRPQWCVTALELLPPSRGINHGADRGCCSRSSTWRRSLPFPTELVPGRTNPTGNNPEQRGFTASL